MAFFRTLNFSDPTPSVAGDGVLLRMPQVTDYNEWAALREAKPRLSHAVGADLAAGRFDPWRLPPPHPPLRRRFAHRPRLHLPDLPQFGSCHGRRLDAGQYPPRGRAGRQSRLLDGPAPHAAGLYDRRGARADLLAFTTLRLHRLEAACIPTNAGSIRLLENTGFIREGYARDYLCINGRVAGPPALRAVKGSLLGFNHACAPPCDGLGMATLPLI